MFGSLPPLGVGFIVLDTGKNCAAHPDNELAHLGRYTDILDGNQWEFNMRVQENVRSLFTDMLPHLESLGQDSKRGGGG